MNLGEPDELKKKEVVINDSGGGGDSHRDIMLMLLCYIWLYMVIYGYVRLNCADNGDERVQE